MIKCLSRKERCDLVSQNVNLIRSYERKGLMPNADATIKLLKKDLQRGQSYGRHYAHVQVVKHANEVDWESNLPIITV